MNVVDCVSGKCQRTWLQRLGSQSDIISIAQLSKPPPPLPTKEFSAVWRGRSEKYVSGDSKCIRMWGGGGGVVNFQFPPWGRY